MRAVGVGNGGQDESGVVAVEAGHVLGQVDGRPAKQGGGDPHEALFSPGPRAGPGDEGFGAMEAILRGG